jgi:hypothetical protein
MANLNTAQRNALNNLSPRVIAAGLQLGTLIDQIITSLSQGNLGISADALDVDSLAKGGGALSYDPDNSAGLPDAASTVGLTSAWKAGRFHNGLVDVTVVAGSILLTASNTNYVELDRAATVSSNTSGFTSGRMPLWTIVTGVNSITSVTSSKALLTLIGTAGVVGAMLSTAAKTKSIEIPLGTLSATGTFRIIAPAAAATVTKVTLTVGTTITTNDTDYWALGLVNKGPAGSGTTALVDATAAANTTKATGGSGITAEVKRNATLSSTPADLNTASEDVLVFTATKNGSAANLVAATLKVDFTFEG